MEGSPCSRDLTPIDCSVDCYLRRYLKQNICIKSITNFENVRQLIQTVLSFTLDVQGQIFEELSYFLDVGRIIPTGLKKPLPLYFVYVLLFFF